MGAQLEQACLPDACHLWSMTACLNRLVEAKPISMRAPFRAGWFWTMCRWPWVSVISLPLIGPNGAGKSVLLRHLSETGSAG